MFKLLLTLRLSVMKLSSMNEFQWSVDITNPDLYWGFPVSSKARRHELVTCLIS